MEHEFQPAYEPRDSNDFTHQDYTMSGRALQPVVTKEQEFTDECERLKQEAIESGHAEGLARANEEIEQIKNDLLEWINLIQKPVRLIDDKVTQEMIQTLIWIAQYCIGVELSVNPEKLRDLFNGIKGELPSLQEDRVVAMNPEDLEWVKAKISIGEVPGLHESLVGDPSLSRGDFYLKGEHSELDGRVHTRLVSLFAKYLNKDNLITAIPSQD
jgi:flagellar assembly protein FliH